LDFVVVEVIVELMFALNILMTVDLVVDLEIQKVVEHEFGLELQEAILEQYKYLEEKVKYSEYLLDFG
jgi:hypothetical protein